MIGYVVDIYHIGLFIISLYVPKCSFHMLCKGSQFEYIVMMCFSKFMYIFKIWTFRLLQFYYTILQYLSFMQDVWILSDYLSFTVSKYDKKKENIYKLMFNIYRFMLNNKSTIKNCYNVIIIKTAYSTGGSYHIILS